MSSSGGSEKGPKIQVTPGRVLGAVILLVEAAGVSSMVFNVPFETSGFSQFQKVGFVVFAFAPSIIAAHALFGGFDKK